MTQFQKGAAALGALQSGGNEGGNLNTIDFAKFSVGSSYKVRVLGTEDLMQYFGYGVYKKVNTFVAKNPSTRNEKGFVVSDHTPWDLAEKYHRDLQFEPETQVTKRKRKRKARRPASIAPRNGLQWASLTWRPEKKSL